MSSSETAKNGTALIAIPMAGERLCMHFGHCEQFALLEVDSTEKKILGLRHVTPPPHEPGLLPRWLHEQGVKIVIAGGMGRRAQDIFSEHGIEVIVGALAEPPAALAKSYLEGSLQLTGNACDH